MYNIRAGELVNCHECKKYMRRDSIKRHMKICGVTQIKQIMRERAIINYEVKIYY